MIFFFLCSLQTSLDVPLPCCGLIHPTSFQMLIEPLITLPSFFSVQSVKESGLLGSFSEASLVCSVTLGKSLNLAVVQFIHYKVSLIIIARFAEPRILFAFFTCAVLRVLKSFNY